jgi:sugar lactone lactonase YvrE
MSFQDWRTARARLAVASFALLTSVPILIGCGGGAGGGNGSGSGGGSGSGSGSGGGGTPTPPAPTSMVALFAGNASGAGSFDATGAAASFYFDFPTGAATDRAGNLYVADTVNSTIRKITPAGVVTTFAGTAGTLGHADGTGAAASFYYPHGVATDAAGNVYVADTGNDTIRMITPAGEVTTVAGSPGASGSSDSLGPAARFNVPLGVTVDPSGNVFVTDNGNATIRKILPGGYVATFAGNTGVKGSADGAAFAATFAYPTGIASDSAGNLYVVDTTNQTIRKVTPSAVVTTFAGTTGVAGIADGAGTTASFNFPGGISVDANDNLYVVDNTSNTVRKITPAGAVSTLAGTPRLQGSADGTGPAARFYFPSGVAADGAGNVYVADGSNTVRRITPAATVMTVAGTAPIAGRADGTGPAASFTAPTGVAVDNAGNLFVADTGNNTIRKIAATGAVTTFAGTAIVTGSADGLGAAASFNNPAGLASDSGGSLYVADSSNNTIRRITPAGVVSTLAGSAGIAGQSDGTGAAASFHTPTGVAVDSAGNVYVADSANNTVRKVTPTGAVTTLAGTAGVAGYADGTGASATFSGPTAVATDSSGNVYVADAGNYTVRKVSSSGVVTTLAGRPGAAATVDGAGLAARFNSLTGIAVDDTGSIYVTDSGGSAIRKISQAGVVTTVVGQAGVAGFVAGGLPGVISYPGGLALAGRTAYFTDHNAVACVSNLP